MPNLPLVISGWVIDCHIRISDNLTLTLTKLTKKDLRIMMLGSFSTFAMFFSPSDFGIDLDLLLAKFRSNYFKDFRHSYSK